MNKDTFKKYFKLFLKYIGIFLIICLCFMGFYRIIELNTECTGFNSYYGFQDTYCETSGILNYKVNCELDTNVPVKCVCDLGLFKFNYFELVVKDNKQQYNFTFN